MRAWLITAVSATASAIAPTAWAQPDPLECIVADREFADLEKMIRGNDQREKLRADHAGLLAAAKKDLLDGTWWATSEWSSVVAVLHKYASLMVETIAVASGPVGKKISTIYARVAEEIEKARLTGTLEASKAGAGEDALLWRITESVGQEARAIYGALRIMRRAFEFKDLAKNEARRRELQKVVKEQLSAIDSALAKLGPVGVADVGEDKRVERIHRELQATLRACRG